MRAKTKRQTKSGNATLMVLSIIVLISLALSLAQARTSLSTRIALKIASQNKQHLEQESVYALAQAKALGVLSRDLARDQQARSLVSGQAIELSLNNSSYQVRLSDTEGLVPLQLLMTNPHYYGSAWAVLADEISKAALKGLRWAPTASDYLQSLELPPAQVEHLSRLTTLKKSAQRYNLLSLPTDLDPLGQAETRLSPHDHFFEAFQPQTLRISILEQ